LFSICRSLITRVLFCGSLNQALAEQPAMARAAASRAADLIGDISTSLYFWMADCRYRGGAHYIGLPVAWRCQNDGHKKGKRSASL
jgi:hypothetical protein